MAEISFVIPCYRSQETIPNVVKEIQRIMKHSKYSYEVILVSDYSPDNVYDVIKELANEFNEIKGIALANNFGQHAALMAGYKYSTGEIIISMDDDEQIPAGEVFKLINAVESGYDVVYGSYSEKKHSRLRNIGSTINDIMAELLLKKPKSLRVSSFFCAKKFIIQEILKYENSYPYLLGLVLRTTANISDVEVEHRERKIGKSNYTMKKLLSLWLNGFTAFSVKPLRIATAVGFTTSVGGFFYGVFTVLNKIVNPEIVAGYSSMMAVILFIGGMIMLMLGLLGEYIGRIYISINKSPQYVIKESINLYEKQVKEDV